MIQGFKKPTDSGDYQDKLRTAFALSLNMGLPLYLLSLVLDEFLVDASFWGPVLQGIAFVFFGICALCIAAIFLQRFRLHRQGKLVPPIFDEREQNVLLQAQAGAFWCLISVFALMLVLGHVENNEGRMESALGLITMGIVAVCVIWVILEELQKQGKHVD